MNNSIKSISTINPAITENAECSIVEAPSFSDLKVGTSLDHGVLLCFVSLLAVWTCWATLQAKNNVRSTPSRSSLTLVSHRSHYACTTNRHLHAKGERNGVNRRTKVSFVRTMMWALELLRSVKRHISGWSNIEQWRNQGFSYSHSRVTLAWRN